MKLSQQPTNYILVKANCQSEWDNCDFAIIFGGEAWAEWLQQRLDATQKVQDYDDFLVLKFLDSRVGFYVSKEDEVGTLLSEGQEWAFVELEEGEEDGFTTPENCLDSPFLSLYKNGYGRYAAYGKYTGEEFYTEQLPFEEIVTYYKSK